MTERDVVFLLGGGLGFVWKGDKEADARYPAASMFAWTGASDTELWMAYSPGRRYPLELWLQGFMNARIKMTVQTFHTLHSKGMAAILTRVAERFVLVHTRGARGDKEYRKSVSGFVKELVEVAERALAPE